MSPPTIFISYSHADETWKDRVVSHLKVLEELAVWDDRQIDGGDNWWQEIDAALNKAAVAVLLISADFLSSDFIRRHEVPALLRRRTSDGVRVIPLLVRPCVWEGFDWLSALQMRPKEARPLSAGSEHEIETDLAALAKEIRQLLRGWSGGRRATQLWTVPYRRNPYFVGREEILEQLRERLARDGKAALGQTQAISGLGGIGKTQTAVEYAYRYRDEYEAVFFVRADNESEILTAFSEQARELGFSAAQEQEQVVATVLAWLKRNAGWLLIFDNADTPEIVKPFLPTDHRGHVLVTSRARTFSGLGIRRPFRMPTLPLNKAVELLLDRSEREGADLGGEERVACEQLAEELGCLPLALEQAGAYLYEKDARFQDYLSGFRSQGLELLDRGKPMDHPEVSATWSLNFREIEETSPASAELLRASAFLSPDEIPIEILRQGSTELGPILAEALAEVQEDALAVDEVLEPLTRYSLILRDRENQTYSVHRLVQAVLEDSMEPSERQLWAERSVRALNQTQPFPEYESWSICDRLLPHALHAHRIIRHYSSPTMEAASLFGNAGSYLMDRARYSEAEQLFGHSLKIIEQVLGKDHPEVAQTLNNLGYLFGTQGRYGEAELFYTRSLEIEEKALGMDHTEVAKTLGNLGNLYYVQGRYGEAEPFYIRSLEIEEKALGKDHPEVSSTLNNLGELYGDQGRYEEAEPLYRRSLEITEKALGKDHPEVSSTLNNLGHLYRDQGRYEEAEPLYLRSLKIMEKALGQDHPEVATTLGKLGYLYNAQGRYREAEPVYQRSLEIEEKAFGKDHPEVTATLNLLGNLHSEQSRYGEAEILFRRSLEIEEKVLGKDHPEVGRTLNNLASLYSQQSRYGEAEPLFQRSLEIFENTLSLDHPYLLQTLKNYIFFLRATDREDEAAELEARAHQ